MKRTVLAALCAAAAYAAPMAAADPLTLASLKALVEGMGYPSQPVGTEGKKIVITYVSDAFNVPIGLEVTESTRYIWLTANLGPSKLTGDQALTLLKRGSTYQPTMFWITSANNLMVGATVENRDVSPVNMKQVIEKLGADIGKTADIWQGAATTAPASN